MRQVLTSVARVGGFGSRQALTAKMPRREQKLNMLSLVWVTDGLGCKSEPTLVKGNMNARTYQEMLERCKLIEDIMGTSRDRNVDLQQDGNPAHRAKSTAEWLSCRIHVDLEWLANSPDHSVAENTCGIIAHHAATAIQDMQEERILNRRRQ
jgi:hypothetical protein